MTDRKKKGIALMVNLAFFVLLILADYYTKQLAVKNLKGQEDIILIPGTLALKYLENRGAAFGILQNMRGFFLVIGFAFLAAAVYFLFRLPVNEHFRPLRAVIVLLAAGAAGNLIDRAFLGYVVDFIYFSLIDFPVFNVADCYVTVGTAILFVLIIFVYKEEELIHDPDRNG